MLLVWFEHVLIDQDQHTLPPDTHFSRSRLQRWIGSFRKNFIGRIVFIVFDSRITPRFITSIITQYNRNLVHLIPYVFGDTMGTLDIY
jgi:hypothetical protein